MAISYGRTWWGERWLGALKNIDFSNRLPRGASYARNGMVESIDFAGHSIKARVRGTRPRPYVEEIKLPQFTPQQIDKLIDIIVAHPVVLSRLFNRQLDTTLSAMATEAGMHLFPRTWSDLQMSCSCPDWAVPCKHLAAVIYKVSMEIDNNPFLIFSLHGVDLLRELQRRGLTAADETVMKVEALSSVLGNDLPRLSMASNDSPLDFTLLSPLTDSLPALLASAPAFYPNGDFLPKYQKELAYMAKTAQRVLQDKARISDEEETALGRNLICTADDIHHLPLLQQVLNVNPDFLRDYDPSVVALRRLLVTALHLMANGCIVPQIYEQKKGEKIMGKTAPTTGFTVLWQPAMIDDATANLVERLGQEYRLLCQLITLLVELFSHAAYDSLHHEVFFKGAVYDFKDIGVTNMPGNIRAWLERYFMQHQFQTTFVVEETEEGFEVQLLVNDEPLQNLLRDVSHHPKGVEILRQLAVLCDMLPALETYVNTQAACPMRFTLEEFTPFLIQIVPAMRLLGVKMVLPKALHELIRPKVSLRLKSKGKESDGFFHLGDLLEFDWRVAVGDDSLTPDEFVRHLGTANGLMRFKEQYVYLDAAAMIKINKALQAPPRLKPGELLQAALSGEYQGAKIVLTEEVREMMRRFTEMDNVPLPAGLNATLRPYQERGYAWMYRNMQLGFGSIIADDMGLGKTLQVISLLLKMKEEGSFRHHKALVVVPTGLLHNWMAEIQRFAPMLQAAIYHGPNRALNSEECCAAEVILTTYGVARGDANLLKKLHLQVLVIDEAQNIKNSSTAQSKALRSIAAKTFIAMSGTPVENRLSEFWSIIDFTNKGYLGTLKEFTDHYARPIQKQGDQHIAARFRKVTAPFMMRRLKTDKSIISDLPDKIESNAWAMLTAEQAALYQETVNRCMAVIEGLEGEDSQTLFQRQGLILQMMLALKQICNHPTQYLKDGRFEPALSGKTTMLLDLLDSIVVAGDKVLVFTQFTEMGELLVRFIREAMGEEAMFYHGGCTLKQRQEMVDRFQNNTTDRIFILSLKAAGTGLNLTAATHVIHYDLWWNPAVEVQATDRAYRIGQHRNVQVHRFITKNTFEERIDEMIQRKRHLADLTVSVGENWIGKLSNSELRSIFG